MPHRASVAQAGTESAEGTEEGDTETLLYEQRMKRLGGARQGCERLAEIIQMVTCAYGLRTLWIPDDQDDQGTPQLASQLASRHLRTPSELVTREMVAEMRDIAARLAPAGQIPLVIGDPLHRTLWIARRPFALVLQRGRVGLHTLETVRSVSGSGKRDAREARGDPVALLERVCGPAGRVLLAQSNALVALAPRVAYCSPEQQEWRWVLAAPRTIYRARGALMLTSWTERLLCLSMRPMGSAQGE